MTSALIVVICVLTAAFVLLPLRSRASSETIEYSNSKDAPFRNPSSRELLVEKRDDLLRQIKELEFDRAMEKINAEDYEHRRGELSEQAAHVLQSLEAGGTTETVAVPDFDVEAEILVARARRKRMAQNIAPSGATWACECGRVMSENDKFCANCGAPRIAVASA